MAKAGRGLTLSTTKAQDEYYLVKTNGSADRISVAEACRVYTQAKQRGELLWGRHAATKSKKKGTAKKKAAKKGEDRSTWREEMMREIGLTD